MELTNEEYFGELKLMFATKGWEILTQELLDNASVIGNVQDIKNQDDLCYRKGQLAVIGQLVNFPDTIKRAEEEHNESVE